MSQIGKNRKRSFPIKTAASHVWKFASVDDTGDDDDDGATSLKSALRQSHTESACMCVCVSVDGMQMWK